jgi:hypothetical protein
VTEDREGDSSAVPCPLVRGRNRHGPLETRQCGTRPGTFPTDLRGSELHDRRHRQPGPVYPVNSFRFSHRQGSSISLEPFTPTLDFTYQFLFAAEAGGMDGWMSVCRAVLHKSHTAGSSVWASASDRKRDLYQTSWPKRTSCNPVAAEVAIRSVCTLIAPNSILLDMLSSQRLIRKLVQPPLA